MVCRNCIATAEVRTLVELSLADKNSNPSIRRHVGYGVVKISGWSVIADTAGQNRFTICRPDQADRRSGNVLFGTDSSTAGTASLSLLGPTSLHRPYHLATPDFSQAEDRPGFEVVIKRELDIARFRNSTLK